MLNLLSLENCSVHVVCFAFEWLAGAVIGNSPLANLSKDPEEKRA